MKGMKFALVELKVALTKIISQYEIFPTERTPMKLEFDEGTIVRLPKNGVNVSFKKRN
jgi:hypothetical protein